MVALDDPMQFEDTQSPLYFFFDLLLIARTRLGKIAWMPEKFVLIINLYRASLSER